MITVDRKRGRQWWDKKLPVAPRCRPWTAAATLPAATMDGGLEMNLASTTEEGEVERVHCPLPNAGGGGEEFWKLQPLPRTQPQDLGN